MSFILFAISGIAWLLLRNRLKHLEQEFEAAGVQRHEFAALTRRVFTLEQLAPPATSASPDVPPSESAAHTAQDALWAELEFTPVESPAAAVPNIEPPPQPVSAPDFADSPAQAASPAPSPAPASPVPAPASRAPAFGSAPREWEALIGGSLLNAIGAIVLVIGIALFLAYSFAHMVAAGRAAVATLSSAAILAAGVWTERKPRYRTFARGLIGAGWAALYATSYAIYAIPAARILPASAGSILQLAVALGIVAHSLRYRAQAVTVVAFSAVFAALAVTPSSPFAVASLIPIAGAVLYLAARFEWDSLPLFGLLATYLTCVSRGESDASLASTQALFLAYWLLFELFDLRRVKLARLSGGLEFLFPLNTAGFLGLSYLAWNHHAPDRLWFAAACASALFLASSVARALLRLRENTEAAGELTDLFQRLRHGSFEASLAVAALLAVLAIVGRAPGVWAAAALAVEAEILYLAGIRFDSRFVRALGTSVFAYSLARLALNSPGGSVVIAGRTWYDWTPAVFFHAAIFYTNRALRGAAVYFSYAASALIAIILFAETPHAILGFAWVAFGYACLQLGLLRRLTDFRVQAYGLLAAGMFVACAYPLANPHGAWWPLAGALALAYACAIQTRPMPALAGWLSGTTSAAAAVLLWRVLPLEYVALSWIALTLALFELGLLRLPEPLRFALGPMTLLAVTGAAATHPELIKFPASPAALTYVALCLGPWIAAAQLTLRPPSSARDWETTSLRDALTALGMMAALASAWMFAPDPVVSILWIALTLALLEAGVRRRVDSFYLLSLAAMAAVYARIFTWDLYNFHHAAGVAEWVPPIALAIAATYWMWRRFRVSPAFAAAPWNRLLLWIPPTLAVSAIAVHLSNENIALPIAAIAFTLELCAERFSLSDLRWQARTLNFGAFVSACIFDIDPARLAISIPTAALCYAAQLAARRTNQKSAPLYYSLLGTTLTAAILYGRVSGGLLTVAWGLLGLSLLGSGFATRERILRLQGLAVFLICILKLFFYDLRNLETLYRILSFVALGVILLSVSWIYSRFRDQIARLL